MLIGYFAAGRKLCVAVGGEPQLGKWYWTGDAALGSYFERVVQNERATSLPVQMNLSFKRVMNDLSLISGVSEAPGVTSRLQDMGRE